MSENSELLKLSTSLPDEFVVLDTETTGLKCATDRIISFGAVSVKNGKIVQRVEMFFNPNGVDIHPEALRIHGITPEFLADKPRFSKQVAAILTLCEGKVVGGQNVKFDLDFLDEEFSRLKMKPFRSFIARGVIDTMHWSREKWPGAKAKLDAICSKLNIKTTTRTLHGALLDAELAAEAILALKREQITLFGERDQEEPSAAQINTDTIHPNELSEVFVLAASPQELSEHERNMRDILGVDAPIWGAQDTTYELEADTEHNLGLAT